MIMIARIAIGFIFVLLVPAIAVGGKGNDVSDYLVAFRIQAYEAFRNDRAEYARRLAKAEQLIEAYRTAPDRELDEEASQWLKAAFAASRPGTIGELPALPTWAENIDAIDSSQAAQAPAMPPTQAVASQLPVRPAPPLGLPEPTSSADRNNTPLPLKTRPAQAPPRLAQARVGAADELWNALASQVETSLSTPDHELDEAMAELEQDPRQREPQAEVTESEAVEELATASDIFPAIEPPSIIEINARIAGHNLALEGLRGSVEAAWQTDGSELRVYVERFATLVDTHTRIQEMITQVPHGQKSSLVPLQELTSFAKQFIDGLDRFTPAAGDEAFESQRIAMIRRLEALLAATR